MKRKSYLLLICLAVPAVLGLGFFGCSTVPETGRKQLNLISPDEEMKLGLSPEVS